MGKIATFEATAIDKAQAKLGKNCKMPKPKFDLDKPEAELLKSIAAFQKVRDDLEKKLADVQNACGKLKTTIKQENAFWSTQQFDNQADSKTVKDAQKIMSDAFGQLGDMLDKAVKSFDDLETTIEKIDSNNLLPWIK
jgi:hypothetical protein